MWTHVLSTVGGLVLLYAAYSVADFVALHFITPSEPLRRYKRRSSSGSGRAWALITGGSAGIGRGVAEELLAQGFNVVLLGHLADELEATKQELERVPARDGGQPRPQVRTLVLDARSATPEQMADAVRSLEDLRVTVLVNNIGGNPIELPPLREVATFSSADVDIVINQNARFMARLTALMLPLLSRSCASADADATQRSLIINMSSMGHVGSPYLVLYGATKAFNLAFSRGLARELEASSTTSNIDCLAIIPGEVRSQGNSRGVPSSAPSWESYGRCLVRTVDGAVKRRMRDLSPHWQHDLEQRILPWLDEGTATRELTKIMRSKKDAWDAFYAKSQ